jgi:hypothetical protein
MWAYFNSPAIDIIKTGYDRSLYIWNWDRLKIKMEVICKVASVLKFS